MYMPQSVGIEPMPVLFSGLMKSGITNIDPFRWTKLSRGNKVQEMYRIESSVASRLVHFSQGGVPSFLLLELIEDIATLEST
jgi:hypothetical protein